MDYSSARVSTDIAGLDRLKAQARQDPAAALDEVAKQFESVLVGMMVKSMRQASLGSGLMDNSQSQMYRDMYDQQLTLNLSQRGLGLAEAIKRQLSTNLNGNANPAEAPSGHSFADYQAVPRPATTTGPSVAANSSRSQTKTSTATEIEIEVKNGAEPTLGSPQRFVDALLPWARDAGAKIGLAPAALLAQAALETGWGRAVIRGRDGTNSHNLFNIKADSRWDGEKIATATLEYEGGVAVRRRDPFRAYPSYQQAFQDYIAFLGNNGRYRTALSRTSDPPAYFSALQQAGYATDPHYADKVLRIMNGRELRDALDNCDHAATTTAGMINTVPSG